MFGEIIWIYFWLAQEIFADVDECKHIIVCFNSKDNTAMRKLQLDRAYLMAFFFVGAAIFMLSRFFPFRYASTNDYETEKEMVIQGVARNILLDSFNRSQKFIVLANGTKVIPPYTYGLWNKVEIGDSIIKRKGRLNYVIYEGPDFVSSKNLNWDRPCK